MYVVSSLILKSVLPAFPSQEMLKRGEGWGGRGMKTAASGGRMRKTKSGLGEGRE